MKKINTEILKEIRDYCMKEYKINTPLELNLYYHIDFTDEVEEYFNNNEGFENMYVASTYNLLKIDDSGEIIEDEFDENLILYHNKNKLPNGWTMDLLNKISPSHSWISDGYLYYDAECLDGVEKLFDLPYYKRIIKE